MFAVTWYNEIITVSLSMSPADPRLSPYCHLPLTWSGDSSRDPAHRGEGAAVLGPSLKTMFRSSKQISEVPHKATTFVLVPGSSSSALQSLLRRRNLRPHLSQPRPRPGISEVTSPTAVVPSVFVSPAGSDSSGVMSLTNTE